MVLILLLANRKMKQEISMIVLDVLKLLSPNNHLQFAKLEKNLKLGQDCGYLWQR